MDESLPSINIPPETIEYGLQKLLGLFGKDGQSRELVAWFKELQETAIRQTSTVHCLGMRTPLAFSSIYQPTRLIVARDPGDDGPREEGYAWTDRVSSSMLRARAFGATSVGIDEFIKRDQDAFIFGGPGWGKTTFLHHVYRSTLASSDILPVLISLRRPTAVDDLQRYVDSCSRIEKKQHRACTLLLVDGYDEISAQQRKRVSEALLLFQSRGAGKFYLTCRDYYHISGLSAPEVRLEAFTREDQVRFVSVFLSAFSVLRQDADTVVTQLEERGFTEFLSHPLLLTLACIVRTTSTTTQPRCALRLLERALDVLCIAWDEQKNIDRQRTTPLDGHDRIRILKQIAYRAKSPFVKRHRAEETARKQLSLLGWDKTDPTEALIEIARFYGILVPAEDGYEFVHRTIHDFLAAKQWVESGDFLKRYDWNESGEITKQQRYEWNARTAYAACLVDDATCILKDALAAPDGLPAATEIIGNYASFDYRTIADALISYFTNRVVQYERRSGEETHRKYSPRITGQLDNDFVRLGYARFLDFLVEYCCGHNTQVSDLLVAYAASELYERMLKLSSRTYAKALDVYKSEKFTFDVTGAKQVQLGFLNPVLQNRMGEYRPPNKQ